jgi:hypothetical protein
MSRGDWDFSHEDDPRNDPNSDVKFPLVCWECGGVPPANQCNNPYYCGDCERQLVRNLHELMWNIKFQRTIKTDTTPVH